MTRRWRQLDPAPRRRHEDRRRRLRPDERDDRIRVTVVLAPRTSARARDAAVHALARQWPQARKYLSFEELCRLHGATEAAADRVMRHFSARGLKVKDVSLPRRTLIFSGEFADVARAFGVRPVVCEHPEHNYRSFEGRIKIPRALARDVTAVLGLDQGPLLHHAAALAGRPARGVDPARVARIYDFPHFVRGLGQTIGIICLGGGFHPRDVKRGESGRGRGSVEVVEIAGARNSPARRPVVGVDLHEVGLGPDDGRGVKIQPGSARFKKVVWTLETSMDVQVAAALAPDARVLVYMAPNTEVGKFDALMHAIMTPNGPSVISCSWGNTESQFTSGWVRLLEEIFQTAALAGITMCYSSGDSAAGAHYPRRAPTCSPVAGRRSTSVGLACPSAAGPRPLQVRNWPAAAA